MPNGGMLLVTLLLAAAISLPLFLIGVFSGSDAFIQAGAVIGITGLVVFGGLLAIRNDVMREWWDDEDGDPV